MQLRPGIYRHYKGNNYAVVGVVRHSENEEVLVVYRQLYGDGAWWVRPLTMFQERVEVAGKEVQRFYRVADLEEGYQPLQTQYAVQINSALRGGSNKRV